MTKRTRLTILFFCVACFFIVSPILIAYSEGYRYDFEKMKIVATGGIYVRTFPAADKITIDKNISEKPGVFSDWIFVQSLLPKNHIISIKKSGYYDYSKILPVAENTVTKLENVLLIKKNIAFKNLANNADYFSISPNNQNIITASDISGTNTFNYFSLNSNNPPKFFSVSNAEPISNIDWSDDSNSALIEINNTYYFFDTTALKLSAIRLSYLDRNSQQISFDPQNSKTLFYIENKTLYSAKGDSSLPIINNIISFKLSGTNIIWLSSNGTLSDSDLSGKLLNVISSKNLSVNSKATYKIILLSQNTFLETNNALFELNQNTKTFETFNIPPSLTNYKILPSGDGQNLIFYSDNGIYLYNIAQTQGSSKFTELFSGKQINYCQWLNNYYIIFTDEDKIMISEIDYRGNINIVTLPTTLSAGAQIFFNNQDNKLYLLNQNALLSSEKLIP